MPRNPHRESFGQVARRRNMPKTQRPYFERLRLNTATMGNEGAWEYYVQSQVPEAWETLEQDIDVDEPKEKITIYLDASVAKFYKAMGRGYQARVNRILATLAQMRIAQIKRLDEMMEEELAQVEAFRE